MAFRTFPLRVTLTLRSSTGYITGIHITNPFRTLQECVEFVEKFCDENYPSYVLEEVYIVRVWVWEVSRKRGDYVAAALTDDAQHVLKIAQVFGVKDMSFTSWAVPVM